MAIFLFFSMAAAAIVDFIFFKFLTRGQTASMRQISLKSLQPHRGIVIFRFFRMAAADILDFKNFKFLTVGTVIRVELRNHIKFCWNRSNRGPDIVIFRFFKDGGRCHLGFWNFTFLTVGRSEVSKCLIVPNFVKIGQTAAEIWRFFDVFFQNGGCRHLEF